jgi:hypothetical protein
MEYLPAARGGGNRSAALICACYRACLACYRIIPLFTGQIWFLPRRLITPTSSLCWRKRTSHSIYLFSLIFICLCANGINFVLADRSLWCVRDTRLGSIAFNAPHYNIKEEQVLQWRHRPLTSSNNEHQLYNHIYHLLQLATLPSQTHFFVCPFIVKLKHSSPKKKRVPLDTRKRHVPFFTSWFRWDLEICAKNLLQRKAVSGLPLSSSSNCSQLIKPVLMLCPVDIKCMQCGCLLWCSLADGVYVIETTHSISVLMFPEIPALCFTRTATFCL